MVSASGARMRASALMNSFTWVVVTMIAASKPHGNTLRTSMKNDDSMVLRTPASI